MNISVEIMGGLNRRITVVLPPEEFDNAFKSELKKASSKTKLDGFRKGSPAAEKMIAKRFGDSIRAEAVDKLINASLFKAFEQEKLNPAGRPAIQSLEAEQGKPFKYTVSFEVYPEVHLNSMNDVTLEKTVVDINDADINQVLEQMRKQYSEWQEEQGASKWGDRLIVDFVRLVDGQPQADSKQQNVPVVLDEKGMPENFHKLVGVKAGDEVVLDLSTNPEDKQQGQIKVIKVEEPKLPVVNDEFAKRLGIEEATVDGLRKQVKTHMQQELDNVLKNKLKTQLIDKLVEKNPVELPKALVEAEQEHIKKEWKERMLKNLGKQNANIQLPEMDEKKSEEIARRRVALSLLFSELIKKHEIKIDEDRVRAQMERIASSFQDSAAIMNMFYKQPEILNNIRSQVMEEQVVEKLLEQVKYTEKSEAYSDIMKFNPQHEHEHDHHDHANCDHDHHEHCDHDH